MYMYIRQELGVSPSLSDKKAIKLEHHDQLAAAAHLEAEARAQAGAVGTVLET
jgi:hypothetical protein